MDAPAGDLFAACTVWIAWNTQQIVLMLSGQVSMALGADVSVYCLDFRMLGVLGGDFNHCTVNLEETRL